MSGMTPDQSPAPLVDGEDIWGPASSSPGGSRHVVDSDSAFPEPSIVVDAQAGDAGSAEGDAIQADATGKPNVAILALAAFIGVAVLGGLGYMGYQTFGRSSPNPVGIPVGAVESHGPAPSTGGGVFDAPAVGSTDVAQDVFSTGSSAGPAAGAEEPSSANVASKVRALDASVAAAQVAVAVEPSAAPVENVSPSTSPSKTPKTTRAAVPKTSDVSSPVVAKAANTKKRPSQKATVAKVGNSSTKRPSNPAGTGKADELPVDDVRVVGIYPLTGKNAQAWLRNKQGVTKVVRQGDVINGIRILAVVPEKGLVKTSFGDLTSQGLLP